MTDGRDGRCASAVIDELSVLDGVGSVNVDLLPGGLSTVTVAGGPRPPTAGQVAAALEEAGNYRLVKTAG